MTAVHQARRLQRDFFLWTKENDRTHNVAECIQGIYTTGGGFGGELVISTLRTNMTIIEYRANSVVQEWRSNNGTQMACL